MTIGAEKYVALTTYRKDGTPKSLPVWIADLGDGTVGFTTPTNSWKVKRLANDNRVQVQPSDSRGNPREGTEPVDGTAVVLDGADLERVDEKVKDKYGYQVSLIRAYNKIMGLIGKGHGPSSAVVITLDA